MALAVKSFSEVVLKLKEASASLGDVSFRPLSKTSPSIERGSMRISWSPKGIFLGGFALVNSEALSYFESLLTFLPSESKFHKV